MNVNVNKKTDLIIDAGQAIGRAVRPNRTNDGADIATADVRVDEMMVVVDQVGRPSGSASWTSYQSPLLPVVCAGRTP
jgi:hypothetical protein